MDWLDLLEVQGTLKSLLQHHDSNASVLQCSTFFMVQLSHPCMSIGSTTALKISPHPLPQAFSTQPPPTQHSDFHTYSQLLSHCSGITRLPLLVITERLLGQQELEAAREK